MNNQTANVLRITESVCPKCLKRIPAEHVLIDGNVYMDKTCPEHGKFSTIIWRGSDQLAYSSWKKEKIFSHPEICLTEVEKGCPYDCGLCADHRQQTCCVLLEITGRCNLNCHYCFASSGEKDNDPSLDQIKEWLELLAHLGKPFIHLSGGEPTVRNDLPEIISLARQMGFSYIQLNTNGVRLGEDPQYGRELKDAGLSSVFMQFDGTKDEIYRRLRGRNLLTVKEKAIRNCGDNLLGVVLVPTIVPGVNDDNIGEIVNYGLSRIPEVRGIHFQPVSYFGRYPAAPLDEQRITLPEIIRGIVEQTDGIFKIEDFAPSGCDHARCGFHGDFLLLSDGSIQALTPKSDPTSCCCKPDSTPSFSAAVEKSRNFVARRWVRTDSDRECCEENKRSDDLDYFLNRLKSHGFSLTGMAFQDCWNIDLERLKECSLHVLNPAGKIIPFCAYNLSSTEGQTLYRQQGQTGSTDLSSTKQYVKNKIKQIIGETPTAGNAPQTEGCLICGQELVYRTDRSEYTCLVCGKQFTANVSCSAGHYICDLCHSADIFQKLESFLMASTEKNPLRLISQVFELPGLNMHGPEYHSIVPAVLVAAYQNLTGQKDSNKIKESIARGSYIKGGGCGYFGTCGACVGTGIALSVLEGVTPMGVEKRALANTITGLALLAISKHGGPRCCKREVITSIKTFMGNTEYFANMSDIDYNCNQYNRNKDCIHEKCPYFPE